jgi:hypothetical protein
LPCWINGTSDVRVGFTGCEKTHEPKPNKNYDEIAEEYHFDYRVARPNRFAKTMEGSPLVVVLDQDVAEVFTTPEAVNKALRALIDAMPAKTRRSTAVRER